MGKPNIKKMKAERDVEGLIKALKVGDWTVRDNAAKALGEIGDARAVQPLMETLNSWEDLKFVPFSNIGSLAVEASAAEALGKIGKPAVEPLIEVLKVAKKHIRKGAALALGKIGDERAVEPLIEALRDEELGVRMDAAEALGKIGEPAVELLIQALKDEDSDVRYNAAVALGKIGDERAVEPLTQALKDKDGFVRWGVKKALKKLKGKKK
jgi:HEAT repeat protein